MFFPWEVFFGLFYVDMLFLFSTFDVCFIGVFGRFKSQGAEYLFYEEVYVQV